METGNAVVSERYASCANARHFSPHYTARVDVWRGEASERHRSAHGHGRAARSICATRPACNDEKIVCWWDLEKRGWEDRGGLGLNRSRGMRRIFTKSYSTALQVAFLCLLKLRDCKSLVTVSE